MFKFYHWQPILAVVLLKMTGSLYLFSRKYLHNTRGWIIIVFLPVILSCKNGIPLTSKKCLASVTATLSSMLPFMVTVMLWGATKVLYVCFPVPSHRIFKRFVLSGWALIKLVILIASSEISGTECVAKRNTVAASKVWCHHYDYWWWCQRFSNLCLWPSEQTSLQWKGHMTSRYYCTNSIEFTDSWKHLGDSQGSMDYIHFENNCRRLDGLLILFKLIHELTCISLKYASWKWNSKFKFNLWSLCLQRSNLLVVSSFFSCLYLADFGHLT